MKVVKRHPLGARRIDHFALTVPNLDTAINFVVNGLGGELVYRLPWMAFEDDSMLRDLDVHPRASVEIALVRLGPTTNFELFEYRSPDQKRMPPRPHHVGSSHLGFFVDDPDAAMMALLDRWGLSVLAPVQTTDSNGPDAGMRWVRLMAPWGMPFELRSMPARLPYENGTSARRFGPCSAWSNRDDGVLTECPVPGLRNVDHVAYTVADLDATVAFFLDTLGAEYLYRNSTSLKKTSLAQALGVPAEGSLERVVLRMGPTDNVELNCYRVPGGYNLPPRNSDIGGNHFALHVDDVSAAAARLADVPGCTVLGQPQTITDGPIAGDQWVYVRTGIGLYLELVRMPDGSLPYERKTSARRRATGALRWSDR
jgi:2-epi-5-epi-valiolone epimerase